MGWIVRLGCLALLLCPSAGDARDLGWAAFVPMLDGVTALGRTPDGLDAYLFDGTRDWPAIRLKARAALDWRRDASLALPVANDGDTPFRLLVRLDDRLEADGGDASLTGLVEIPPHTRTTVLLPLDAAPLGMRAHPPGRATPGPGDRLMTDVRGTVDLRHIVAMHLSGVQTGRASRLAFGPPSLRDAGGAAAGATAAGGALVDGYGQAIAATWPGKIDSDAGLASALAGARIDTARLAASAFPPADRYGGVGPALPASGVFRVAKLGGRWSLVTPAGHRFFSLGVDSVAPDNPTIVEGRERLFATLPRNGADTPFYGSSMGRRTFDFGSANLFRGLGSGWAPRWRRDVLARLRAWGFNTLGNWSAPLVTEGGAMPHVTCYDVEGDSEMIAMGNGRSLPDPFDPAFAGVADRVAGAMTASRRADPTLIGYFSGNEMPWGTPERPAEGIAARVLALGPGSFAKRAWLAAAQARYGTAAAARAAWEMPGPDGWAALLATPLPWPAEAPPALRRDAESFEDAFATRYFRTVAQAIKRHDPDHLYLGTRFAAFTPAVVRACARWCDVVSFNVYGRSPAEASAAWRGLDKPVLIGEFHFGSTDRGPYWPGMVAVDSEARRGPAYAAYLAAAVADPAIVGAHWYQYADEPVTGRPYDGENGHIGLVAITDVPFAGFVAEVAAANRAALARFADPGRPVLRGTQE